MVLRPDKFPDPFIFLFLVPDILFHLIRPDKQRVAASRQFYVLFLHFPPFEKTMDRLP